MFTLSPSTHSGSAGGGEASGEGLVSGLGGLAAEFEPPNSASLQDAMSATVVTLASAMQIIGFTSIPRSLKNDRNLVRDAYIGIPWGFFRCEAFSRKVLQLRSLGSVSEGMVRGIMGFIDPVFIEKNVVRM